jgi:hypothetical protein
MKIKYVNQLAEAISSVRDLAERARIAQKIGLICQETRPESFDWARWNQACKIHGDDE